MYSHISTQAEAVCNGSRPPPSITGALPLCPAATQGRTMPALFSISEYSNPLYHETGRPKGWIGLEFGWRSAGLGSPLRLVPRVRPVHSLVCLKTTHSDHERYPDFAHKSRRADCSLLLPARYPVLSPESARRKPPNQTWAPSLIPTLRPYPTPHRITCPSSS